MNTAWAMRAVKIYSMSGTQCMLVSIIHKDKSLACLHQYKVHMIRHLCWNSQIINY